MKINVNKNYYDKEDVITAIWEYFRKCNTRETAEQVVKDLPIYNLSCNGCKYKKDIGLCIYHQCSHIAPDYYEEE